MYDLSKISEHRDWKLKTLLSDEVGSVLKEFEDKLQALSSYVDVLKIRTALDYALKQDYGSGELVKFYVTHPVRVASFIMDWMLYYKDYSSDLVVASLIHNVIEKDILTEEELEKMYGNWMRKTIVVLTQDREALKDPKEKEKYYERIYALDKYGQLIKFFDKFDNLYAICLNPSDATRTQYIQEIKDKVRVIAEKFSPITLPYFDALVHEMIKFGHYHPVFK